MRTPLSAFLVLVIAVAPAGLRAQTVDTAIVGTVTDRSGAVIPGAKVTVTSVSTGVAKSAVTTATGEYTVNYLPPGSYNVEVTANGFATTRQQGIELQLSPAGKGQLPTAGWGGHAAGDRSRSATLAADRSLLSGHRCRRGGDTEPSPEWAQI